MTPERIEEIKRKSEFAGVFTLTTYLTEALAALEEAQHLLQDHGPQGRNYTNEQYVTLQQSFAVQEDTIKFLDSKLAEAQQTIAQLRKVNHD